MRKQPKVKKNIYMTNEAIRLKNTKGRLWKIYKATRSKHDRQNYIQCKNKLRMLTTYLRGDFERDFASMVKEKPKCFGSMQTQRLKTKPSIPALTKPDGSKATTPKDKADTLNNFFTSVFTIENMETIPATQSCRIDEIKSTIDITPEMARCITQPLLCMED